MAVCVLAGCGKTASCNDAAIKKTVVMLIEEQVKATVWGREIFEKGYVNGFELTGVKVSAHDKELGTYMCEANTEVKFNGKNQLIKTKYGLAYMEDKNDTEVTVYGIDDIKTRLMVLAMFGR